MNITEQNAIRGIARRAWAEIQEEWKINNASSVRAREQISRRILLNYEKQVAPRFNLIQIVYWIGVIRGVVKER